MTNLKYMVAMLSALALILGTAGCSSTNDFNDNAQHTCVAKLTDAEIQQAKSQLDQVSDVSKVQNVCVYDNGQIHYYRQNDGLNDWLLYAAFTGRFSSFGALYTLEGGSPFTALLIDHMIGFNSYGQAFRPYSQFSGGYERVPRVLNQTVTNVYYGAGSGTKVAFGKPSPSGYNPVRLKPSSSVDGVGKMSGSKPVTVTSTTGGKTVSGTKSSQTNSGSSGNKSNSGSSGTKSGGSGGVSKPSGGGGKH
jgi:hypothetical protein